VISFLFFHAVIPFDQVQAKLKAQMVSLEMAKPQLAAEYYTPEEMVRNDSVETIVMNLLSA